MVSKSLLNKTWLILSLMVFSIATGFAQADVKAGKTLFRDNCAACHNKDMKSKLVGPALEGARERWKDFPEEDLLNWIRNAPKMIKSGHKRAVEVFEENNKLPMTAFDGLSDDDIRNILAYIDDVTGVAPAAGGDAAATGGGDFNAGKALFRDNCAACHNKDMKTKLVGPGLAGVEDRWKDFPKEDLHAWIRNAPKLIESGHKKAVEVFEANNKLPMTAFESLSDEDIDNILAYINGVASGKTGGGAKSDAGAGATAAAGKPVNQEGKKLFRDNCAACHNKDMKTKMTGPALGGVEERWADYPKEDLYAWIRNSQDLISKAPKLEKNLLPEEFREVLELAYNLSFEGRGWTKFAIRALIYQSWIQRIASKQSQNRCAAV